MNLSARLRHNRTLKKPNLHLSVIAMALDITDYLPDIFEYLCETARLHLVHCIPRLTSLKATPKAHASWTDTDITQLISFLYEHWAEGTDGGFKKSTRSLRCPTLSGRTQLDNNVSRIQFFLVNLCIIFQSLSSCNSGHFPTRQFVHRTFRSDSPVDMTGQ